MDFFLPLIGYITSLMALSFAYIQWRKNIQLQSILNESLSQNESLKIKVEKSFFSTKDQKSKESKRTSTIERLEKSLNTVRDNNSFLKEKIEQQKKVQVIDLDQKDALVEKYQDEAKALTKQIIELDQGQTKMKADLKRDLLDTMGKETREFKELETIFSGQKIKFDETKKQLKETSTRLTKIEKILTKVDPKETRAVKRKLKQYSQIFMVLRGQKELAEELSKNWEIALRQASVWIINKKKPKLAMPESTGQLAAIALEIIGGQLMDEDDERKEKDQVESLEQMLSDNNIIDQQEKIEPQQQ